VLALGSIGLTAGFGSTTSLASAYGIAVTGTMGITTIAFALVTLRVWHWPAWKVWGLCSFLLLIDIAFFSCNLFKIFDGGWVPVVAAGLVFAVMHTWKKGRALIAEKLYRNTVDESVLLDQLRAGFIPRTGCPAVFMTSIPNGVPVILLHHLKASGSLHPKVILLSLVTTRQPYQRGSNRLSDRLEVTDLGEGVWRVVARYGYMQTPRLAAVLRYLAPRLKIRPKGVMFYFNRESVATSDDSLMWRPQQHFYSLLSRLARPAREYFGIPTNQICEIGLPVQL